MGRDETALELARYYSKVIRSRGYFGFPKVDYKFKKTKWYPMFLKIANYRILKDWTPKLWIDCMFEEFTRPVESLREYDEFAILDKERDGNMNSILPVVIMPHRLYGVKAEQAFDNLKDKIKNGKTNSEKQIISSMLSTYNTVKLWMKKNNETEIRSFFQDKTNIFQIKRNMFSIYFLSVCKSLYEEKIELTFIWKDELAAKRKYVHSNKKLKAKLQTVLGEEFY